MDEAKGRTDEAEGRTRLGARRRRGRGAARRGALRRAGGGPQVPGPARGPRLPRRGRAPGHGQPARAPGPGVRGGAHGPRGRRAPVLAPAEATTRAARVAALSGRWRLIYTTSDSTRHVEDAALPPRPRILQHINTRRSPRTTRSGSSAAPPQRSRTLTPRDDGATVDSSSRFGIGWLKIPATKSAKASRDVLLDENHLPGDKGTSSSSSATASPRRSRTRAPPAPPGPAGWRVRPPARCDHGRTTSSEGRKRRAVRIRAVVVAPSVVPVAQSRAQSGSSSPPSSTSGSSSSGPAWRASPSFSSLATRRSASAATSRGRVRSRASGRRGDRWRSRGVRGAPRACRGAGCSGRGEGGDERRDVHRVGVARRREAVVGEVGRERRLSAWRSRRRRARAASAPERADLLVLPLRDRPHLGQAHRRPLVEGLVPSGWMFARPRSPPMSRRAARRPAAPAPAPATPRDMVEHPSAATRPSTAAAAGSRDGARLSDAGAEHAVIRAAAPSSRFSPRLVCPLPPLRPPLR